MNKDDIQKYISDAKLCAGNTIGWIVPPEHIEQIIEEFKKVCPTIKHKVSMDWDDDTLLWLRFTWENNAWNPVKLTTLLQIPGTVTIEPSKKERPPSARYGGPRW